MVYRLTVLASQSTALSRAVPKVKFRPAELTAGYVVAVAVLSWSHHHHHHHRCCCCCCCCCCWISGIGHWSLIGHWSFTVKSFTWGFTALVHKIDALVYALALEVNTGNRQTSLAAYGERVISCLSDQGTIIEMVWGTQSKPNFVTLVGYIQSTSAVNPRTIFYIIHIHRQRLAMTCTQQLSDILYDRRACNLLRTKPCLHFQN